MQNNKGLPVPQKRYTDNSVRGGTRRALSYRDYVFLRYSADEYFSTYEKLFRANSSPFIAREGGSQLALLQRSSSLLHSPLHFRCMQSTQILDQESVTRDNAVNGRENQNIMKQRLLNCDVAPVFLAIQGILPQNGLSKLQSKNMVAGIILRLS